MTILILIPIAFGYTVLILIEASIFAIVVWAATGNGILGGYTFCGGIFLGILAVLTDELKKREVPAMQQPQEKQAVTSHSQTPVLTWNALGTHQVSTRTIVDFNLSISSLNLAIRTDSERSTCILKQYDPTNTSTNQVTQNTQN